MIANVLVVIAAVATLWLVYSKGSTGAAPTPGGPARGSAAPVESVRGLSIGADAPSVGEPLASVVVVEYSDFQCPFCGRYATETFVRLRHDFIDPGRVRYFFKHFPLEGLHPLATGAAEAAACASSQQGFWKMHDAMFADQGRLGRTDLLDRSMALGLNRNALEACLTAGTGLGIVRADKREGEQLLVRSTPTFFIGRLARDGKTVTALRKINGAQPYEVFKHELENAGAHPASGS